MHDSISQNPAAHDHPHTRNRFSVIPTPEKLAADRSYTGRGVRIAFLDSGFYPHPDIARRIVHFHDISREETALQPALEPAWHHWHGTQTAVSCAGDGRLSEGVFRGIASEAELILIKVSSGGRISDRSIEIGLKWVVENHEKYNIRILNISLGGDCDRITPESTINQLAELLVRRGVVITVAAGNSLDRRPIPPASAPSVITVGGHSDENTLQSKGRLYHSSFGSTSDAVLKPEVIAPAMFVATPILPSTRDYIEAELLTMLSEAPDYGLPPLLGKYWKEAGLTEDILRSDADNARKIIQYAIRRKKVVGTHYQHVDGTSFAAPIVASVVAQMLEANPALSPALIKDILVSTSLRIESEPAARQGFGVLNAVGAVHRAVMEKHRSAPQTKVDHENVHFYFHDDFADAVSVSGDFNWWKPRPLVKRCDGIWECRIPRPPKGRYLYKFLINGVHWIEDPSHGLKIHDEFGGFNSILVVP